MEYGFDERGPLTFTVLKIIKMVNCSFQYGSIASVCEKSMVNFGDAAAAWGW
jgi:hypothetical protein